ELYEKGLWTRVQIPPAPPFATTKAARFNRLAAFFHLYLTITFFESTSKKRKPYEPYLVNLSYPYIFK
ncbi:MAG TPA: hypothetical protein PKY33_00005, partial [Limnohabitans sp.]|uniref:hypothetical protein n=1 Tax=Limnohabitans sp. TaxID=1907725 RepID=UPI002CEFBC2E